MSDLNTEIRQLPETLRQLGIECVQAIRSDVQAWHRTTVWLETLPLCWAVTEAPDPEAPELSDGRWCWANTQSIAGHTFYYYDNEEKERRTWGPICRRIFCAFDATLYRFHSRAGDDLYSDFGIEDARRVTILSALILNRDFDGSELGLGWPWEKPADAQVTFEGRGWAWAKIMSDLFLEESLAKLITMSLDHLRKLGDGGNASDGTRHVEPDRHKDWLTVTKVAKITGLSVGEVSRKCTNDELKTNGKTGRGRRICPTSVTQLEQRLHAEGRLKIMPSVTVESRMLRSVARKVRDK